MGHSNQKQHTLWLLAAVFAPLAHFSGGGWFAALLAALVVLPAACLPASWEGMSKTLAWIQILWLGIVAGGLLRFSSSCWPSGNDLAVPLTLIVLAALTGPKAAPRVGAVLAFCLLVLAIPMAAAGAMQLELGWLLQPAAVQWPAGLVLTLLLTALPAAGPGKGSRALGAGVLAVALAALIQGILSPRVASSVAAPFYEMARTLSPGGISHIEPVAAVALTLGWYALCTSLFQSGAIIARGSGISEKTARVLAVGTATARVLFPQQLWEPGMAVFSAFLWVLIPFLRKKINFKKTKKNA